LRCCGGCAGHPECDRKVPTEVEDVRKDRVFPIRLSFPVERRSAPSRNGGQRFGAWRRSGFRSTKLSASTELDTKHKASFNH
jgi:hypothetical protein